MVSIVVPYENPDLDGVACAISLAAIEPAVWVPRVIGSLDAETKAVLAHLELPRPAALLDYNDVEAIWLVDTHYPQTAPVPMPLPRVVRITDHHPAGSGPAFPNAEVQNELVGAAATLVTERYRAESIRIAPRTAVLLQAAILSNTLEFQAPASSLRDKTAYDLLAQIQPLNDELRTQMRSARQKALDGGTAEIFARGTKCFPLPEGIAVISQIESPGAASLLIRPDLDAVLFAAAHNAQAKFAIWNIVDTNAQMSAIICTNPAVLQVISAGLGEEIGITGRLIVRRILQRKTDIVPFVIP